MAVWDHIMWKRCLLSGACPDLGVGIICSSSNVSALGTYALLCTGIFQIGKLQLVYNSIKVVRKNKNQGVESD